MVIIINELYGLPAEFALSWLLSALFSVVSILILFSSKSTIFTCYIRMFFFIVLFFLAFGNTSATLLAFVVLPGAADIVHSKFADFDVLLAEATPFCFYRFFH